MNHLQFVMFFFSFTNFFEAISIFWKLLNKFVINDHKKKAYMIMYAFFLPDILNKLRVDLGFRYFSFLRKLKYFDCMQDTFARATHSAGRPSTTIGYLVYKYFDKGAKMVFNLELVDCVYLVCMIRLRTGPKG